VNRFELAVGWYGNYDRWDIAALGVLSQGPPVSAVATAVIDHC